MRNDLTVTFFSNFLLHHQTPFCEAMVRLIGNNFHFVATEKIPEERLAMGYSDLSHSVSYAVNSYENYDEALRLARESDVVILGDAPDEFINDRLNENKLTFRYSERYFKEGRIRILDPRVLKARYEYDIRYRRKNLHMLCASAYTAPDCRFIFAYPDKCYKWGYFPPIKEYGDIDGVISNKKPNTILWVGRMLDWKHPEDAVEAMRMLVRDGRDVRLTIIGEGERKDYLKRLIAKYHLEEKIELLGFMKPDEVREYMDKADIFLFTSDRNEGWGAVLNESMNSACAVVASREIGSVPYIVENGKNGLIYDRKGKNSLYANIKKLLDDDRLKTQIQKNAYETMTELWNADVASERLIETIDLLQHGKKPEFKTGPCSKG